MFTVPVIVDGWRFAAEITDDFWFQNDHTFSLLFTKSFGFGILKLDQIFLPAELTGGAAYLERQHKSFWTSSEITTLIQISKLKLEIHLDLHLRRPAKFISFYTI